MKLVCLVAVLLLLTPRWGTCSRRNRRVRSSPIPSCGRTPLLSCEDMGLGEWVKGKGLGKCHKVDVSSKLNANSLAPWFYLKCIDHERFPRALLVAECEAEYCRDPVAVLPSVPVVYRQEVKYHYMSDGKSTHCAATLEIPVACTCLQENKRPV